MAATENRLSAEGEAAHRAAYEASQAEMMRLERAEAGRSLALEAKEPAMTSAYALITRAAYLLPRHPVPRHAWQAELVSRVLERWRYADDNQLHRNGDAEQGNEVKSPAFVLGPNVDGTVGLVRTNPNDLERVVTTQALHVLVGYASVVVFRRLIAEHCRLNGPEAQLLLFQNVRVYGELSELAGAIADFNARNWLEEHEGDLPRIGWPKRLQGTIGLVRGPTPFTDLGLFDLNGRAFNPFESFGRNAPEELRMVAGRLRSEAASKFETFYGPSRGPSIGTDLSAAPSPS